MRPFDFYAPTTVVEALTLLDQYKDSVACIAGGTDLTLELNEWKAQPAVVIDLKKLKELDYIKVENGIVRIGALTSHAEVAANDIIRENVHILYDACRQVGSPQIRNRGTIGGNIANASPAADTLGPLALLNARLTLLGPQGTRELPLCEVITAPYRNALLPGELITAVRIDKLDCTQKFFKLGRRRALAISRLTVSVAGRVENGKIAELRVALGSAFPRPMRFPEITDAAVGQTPTPELLRHVAEATAAKLPEIAGIRASTLYKQPVSQKLLERLLGEVFEVKLDG